MGTLCPIKGQGVWPVRWGYRWGWGMCVKHIIRKAQSSARGAGQAAPAKPWEEVMGNPELEWGQEAEVRAV